MKLYVAVTDGEWYRFLRARPDLDEVNFWQPGGKRLFRVLQRGQPFLFKLHAPHHFVVGGGFFAHSSLLPSSLAWEAFGEKNGAASFPEMQRRIEKYRRIAPQAHEDYTVGCIILQQPFFFDEADWIPVPKDFSPNIVQGKGYDLRDSTGRELWEEVLLRIQRMPAFEEVAEARPEGELYGDPQLVRLRLGQGGFRILVTDAYERRCAVTQERALPVLEAAHVLPVSEGGQHEVANGLLLRADLHRLFDRGYVTITPDHRFRVSQRLKKDFDNGEPYFPLERQEIHIPGQPDLRPRREFLAWHGDVVFRG